MKILTVLLLCMSMSVQAGILTIELNNGGRPITKLEAVYVVKQKIDGRILSAKQSEINTFKVKVLRKDGEFMLVTVRS